jgi:hypothetical protein
MAAQRTARKQSRSKRDEPQDEATQYEQELASYLQERIKPGLNKGSIPLLARSIAKEIAHRERPDGASSDSGDQDEPGAEADVEPTDEAEDEPRDEAEDQAGDEPEDEDELDDEPRDEAEDDDDDELDDEPRDEAEDEDEPDDEPSDEAEDEDLEDEPDDEEDDVSQETEQQPDFEADMRELQAELGDEWVLAFSVKGDEAWLTAEKEDGSQHVEAQTADLLLEAVELLEEGGGRSG